MSNDDLGMSEKLLVIQFLGVLHTWLQEQRTRQEADIALLKMQESLVKLLFARVSRPDLYSEPQYNEAGGIIFGGEDEDWYDIFDRERDALSSVGVELNEREIENYNNVIDFFTRKRKNPSEEE